jgi:hypothetical protein
MRNASSSPRRCLLSYALIACLSLVVPLPARGQQASSSPTNQDEVNKQLLQRLQELEDEVKQLKAQAAAPAATPAAAPAPAPLPPTPTASATAEMPQVNEVAPRLKLDIFGDVGAQKYTHTPDTFVLGTMDLFMTARLSDKFSALGELLFVSESDNTIAFDIERLWLKYRQSQYFSASIGRFNSWVGYYNSTYNKAEYLETTTDRPFIYDFDDEGGVLPMQEVGVNVTGEIPSGNLGLNYVLELGNGRAWGLNVEPAQNNQDTNNSKSINGGLFMRPKKYRGLQLGFSLRHDNLTVPGPPVAETIVAAHAVFNNGTYEIERGRAGAACGAHRSRFQHDWRLYPVVARVSRLQALFPVPVL